jgi:hypothetical protein
MASNGSTVLSARVKRLAACLAAALQLGVRGRQRPGTERAGIADVAWIAGN